ncbi:hypothetical protein MANES_11G120850v8 [Manihot esculenta]|uniref:Uncharacterized protein n=1 Tax=Manihot esculenta TaxID=3983 RepID=A0ACB7GWQ7_MANES|nr:hypothetical protein MANES_11G120850v8 [Manihot esculenta]
MKSLPPSLLFLFFFLESFLHMDERCTWTTRRRNHHSMMLSLIAYRESRLVDPLTNHFYLFYR